jgi:MFS family permease
MVPESWCVHIEVQQVCVYDADLHHQFLFYGWGCIFWQAIALQYGKRPVYLMSLLMNVIILAAAPLCTTSGPYLANRILLGFFGSPVESLAEISVTDIWFNHQRPKYMALYGWSLSMCGKFAPMLSGLINVGMGWKWTLWWCSIICGIGFVYCFLFLEETNYDRKHTIHQSHVDTSAHAEVRSEDPTNIKGAEVTEKSAAGEDRSLNSPDRERGEVIWPRKSYWDKLGFKDTKRPNRLIPIMLAPFVGFTYPPVVYAGYVSDDLSTKRKWWLTVSQPDVRSKQPRLARRTKCDYRNDLHDRVWLQHRRHLSSLCRRCLGHDYRVCLCLPFTKGQAWALANKIATAILI